MLFYIGFLSVAIGFPGGWVVTLLARNLWLEIRNSQSPDWGGAALVALGLFGSIAIFFAAYSNVMRLVYESLLMDFGIIADVPLLLLIAWASISTTLIIARRG